MSYHSAIGRSRRVLVNGVYQHWRTGFLYRVHCVSRHADRGEVMVTYYPTSAPNTLWTHRLDDWNLLTYNGEAWVRRFTLID